MDERNDLATEFDDSSSLAANKINMNRNINESMTTDEAQDAKSELPILEIKRSMGEISSKRISELTSSATDFVFSNSNPNINATSYRVIPGTGSSGFYSPSTAEARIKDAAAKDSNLSNTAKLIRKQQEELGSSSLGSITGGIRVLPSPKLFNKSSQCITILYLFCTILNSCCIVCSALCSLKF